MIVIAIMSSLVGAATLSLDWAGPQARQAALEHNLKVIRQSIDDFKGDRGRYPRDLQELVDKRYLRDIPIDPMTRTITSWHTIPSAPGRNDVYDVRSQQEAGS